MPEQPPNSAVVEARDSALTARQLSDAHQRANRDADPGDLALAAQGDELKRLATEASARFEIVKQQVRAAASVKRHQDEVAHDAELQGRLRAEAQARRDAAAAAGPPPPRRGHR